MILDSLDNLKRGCWPPVFRKAFDFLKTLPPDAADGTIEIQGRGIYASIQSGITAGTMPDKLELHRKYIDIQYLCSGTETLAWAPEEDLEVIHPYEEDKDYSFVRAPADTALFSVKPGFFAVFFPGDAHSGRLSGANGDAPFRKVVIKVAVDLL